MLLMFCMTGERTLNNGDITVIHTHSCREGDRGREDLNSISLLPETKLKSLQCVRT